MRIWWKHVKTEENIPRRRVEQDSIRRMFAVSSREETRLGCVV
jgi:hypothetical protein